MAGPATHLDYPRTVWGDGRQVRGDPPKSEPSMSRSLNASWQQYRG